MKPAAGMVLWLLAACGSHPVAGLNGEESKPSVPVLGLQPQGYLAVSKVLDGLASPASPGKGVSGFRKTYSEASSEEKTRLLLGLADDIAIAEYYGWWSGEMKEIAAFAVREYPHPLLLNNLAAVLHAEGDAPAAVTLLEQALAQLPGNPILYTNLASIHLASGRVAEAERCAKRALALEPQFGPAFQILTCIHLKNQNSLLAAETMVKSARHCFDNRTIYHFESFLSAVAELDPLKDDYPLKEEFLKELHLIARSNVDTLGNDQGSDTPGKQLRLKPFPQITGPENLRNSWNWLTEQLKKADESRLASLSRCHQHRAAEEKRLRRGDPAAGKYPVFKHGRQLYAMKILQSYYDFSLQKRLGQYYKDIEKIREAEGVELEQLGQRYEKYFEEAKKGLEGEMARTWAGMIQALDGGALPDVEKLQNLGLLAPKIGVMRQKETIKLHNQHASDIITASQQCYKDVAQLLEEYWLKMGGLLKYILDEGQFELSCAEREAFVFSHVSKPLSELESRSRLLLDAEDSLKAAEHMLRILEKQVAGHKAAMDQAKQEEARKKREESGQDDFIPDIEKEAISKYKEKDDIGTIGADVSLFGLVGASTSYNGEEVSVEANSVAGSVSGTKTFVKDEVTGAERVENTAVVLYGVSATGSTEWISEKAVDRIMKHAGGLGKGAGVLGKIGFGFSSGTRVGEYVVMDEGKKILDRGMVHVRESGGDVGPIGRSTKVEVRKSYMTGVAIKSTTTKYKFLFGTYEK